MKLNLKPPGHENTVQPGFKAPGIGLLMSHGAGMWLLTAVICTSAGLYWRTTGTGPGIAAVLDCLGLFCWLIPMLLLGTWELISNRITRHQSTGTGVTRSYWALSGTLLLVGFTLTIAPFGLFSAYDSMVPAAEVITLEQFQFYIGYPLFVLGLLSLAGTVIVLFSMLILTSAKRLLGDSPGITLWILLGCLVNLNALSHSNQTLPLSFSSIMIKAQEMLNFTNLDPARSINLSDLIVNLIGMPLLVVSVILFLLTGVQRITAKPGNGNNSIYTVLLGGVIVPALASWYSASVWSTDYNSGPPGSWLTIFSNGLTAMLILLLLIFISSIATFGRTRPLGAVAILLPAIPFWIVLSIPSISAGVVSLLEVIPTALASLVLVGFWFAMLNAVSMLDRGYLFMKWLAVVIMLVAIVIPLDGFSRTSLIMALDSVQGSLVPATGILLANLLLTGALVIIVLILHGIGRRITSSYLTKS